MIPEGAITAQRRAADPGQSTWLGANAGSGKTRVLTNRVARLLLDGAPPQNILCLTYTKAAAGEMQNRLFATLGDWAMKDDVALTAALRDLGEGGDFGPDRLNRARRLFASAIETPGGLKLQTIHAFCSSILRQFPLEARVSPDFTEIDDRSAAILRDEVLEALAEGQDRGAIDALAEHLSSDDALAGIAQTILSKRDAFAAPLDRDGALALHGLAPWVDADALLDGIFDGDEADLFAAILPRLRAKGGNDGKAAERLAALGGDPATLSGLAELEQVFLYGATAAMPFGAKTDRFPTKPVREAMPPDQLEALQALMERVAEARPTRLALAAADRTAAMHRFAAAFLPAVTARKAARGWLDFDDLIMKTRALLADTADADWVLYKIDGRIDHVLVDEAQDTSPDQWRVVQLLTREMTAGAGARDGATRTVFVVGDKKQSIYSFQGADPAGFDRMRDHFATRLEDAGGLADLALEHSFRSAPAILRAVDAVFADAPGVGGTPHHIAARDMPGRVDVWPLVEPLDAPDDRDWFDPRDMLSAHSPESRLADAIAGELRRLIDAGTAIPRSDGSVAALAEGDVLVLVQRRGAMFREVIRACKAQGLAIAGVDRMVLTRELAVKDLLACLSFLALPEDDLSLAAALRSPIFGWSEDALYRVAQPRKGYLWQAVRQAADAATRAIVDDLLDHADYQRPYDLLERILTRHGGRARLIARLGPDCEEAIDALLEEALRFESTDVPSLTGFLEWMLADAAEIKREAEAAGRRLRVMTVHGAKGLEAPLVILPDCAARRAPSVDPVQVTADGPIWLPSLAEADDLGRAAADASRARQAEERQRLLYVAMTRAESWLWICAAGKPDTAGSGWHAIVQAGLSDAATHPFPTGDGLRLAEGAWPEATERMAAEADPTAALPGWATRPAPPAADPTPVLTPSGLGGAKALPGEAGQSEAEALAHGLALHTLLEHLPHHARAGWPVIAEGLIGERAETLLDEAAAILTDPRLGILFGPDTLAEVPLTAPLPAGRRLRGTIDRLVIDPETVLAVDFKTNAVVPDGPGTVPEGLMRQMGAYAAALAAIYPDRRIDTAILWTRSATLMPLPAEATAAAFARAGTA